MAHRVTSGVAADYRSGVVESTAGFRENGMMYVSIVQQWRSTYLDTFILVLDDVFRLFQLLH